jgi:HK97 family phage portal protein
MAEILGPTGLPLRSRPAGANNLNGSQQWFIQSLNADRWTDATDDAYFSRNLVSYETIYRTQPAVHTAVNKITRRIASLPFEAFEQISPERRGPLPKTDTLERLIRRPWPRASKVQLLTHIAQGLLIHGNALLVKVREDGPDEPPTALYPLAWTHLSAYAPSGGPIVGWSTTQFDGQERWLRPEDVIHFAWMAPDGNEIGIALLEALGTTVRIEDAATRYQTAQFRNGNRPSLAVSVDMENPKVEVLDWMRERVESIHKGPDQAGKTIFTGAKTKMQPLSLTPVEAELIEQRTLNMREVGMVYDLAGPLMNDLSHATLANVEEYQKAMYRDVVPPWTTLIVETIQTQLLDPEDAWKNRVIRFDFTDKLRGDPLEMSQAMRSDVEGGLRTRNEARRLMGIEPYGDPDDDQNPANKLTLAVNNQGLLEDVGKEPEPVVSSPGPPQIGSGTAPEASETPTVRAS